MLKKTCSQCPSTTNLVPSCKAAGSRTIIESYICRPCLFGLKPKPKATSKLTGHECSVLAFLAQRPAQLEEFRSSLGADALQVARYLAGELNDPPLATKMTGDAIRAWAREREAREGKKRP